MSVGLAIIIVPMWTGLLQLLEFLGVYEPKPCKAARTQLRQSQPLLQILGTRLITRNANEWIVAVFFQEPHRQVKPARYKLFSVSDDLSKIIELPCEPTSLYWIRGRK
jgi:hypothetical protein